MPLGRLSPSPSLTMPSPTLNCVPKHHIYTSFKYLQGCWLNHFLGQPIPILDNPLGEQIFPKFQSKSWYNLRPLPLVPSLVTWEKRPTVDFRIFLDPYLNINLLPHFYPHLRKIRNTGLCMNTLFKATEHASQPILYKSLPLPKTSFPL